MKWRQKIWAGPSPPHLDKIQKNSNFFFVKPSLTQYTVSSPRNAQLSQLDLVLCSNWKILHILFTRQAIVMALTNMRCASKWRTFLGQENAQGLGF